MDSACKTTALGGRAVISPYSTDKLTVSTLTLSSPQHYQLHIQAWQDGGLSKMTHLHLHHLSIKTYDNQIRQLTGDTAPSAQAALIPARLTLSGVLPPTTVLTLTAALVALIRGLYIG